MQWNQLKCPDYSGTLITMYMCLGSLKSVLIREVQNSGLNNITVGQNVLNIEVYAFQGVH